MWSRLWWLALYTEWPYISLPDITLLFQKHNRKLICCNILAGLAISDNILLLNACHLWVTTVLAPDAFTLFACKFMVFHYSLFVFNSTMLVVLVTAERYLAVVSSNMPRRNILPNMLQYHSTMYIISSR